jgi:hypothetical protein
MNPGTFQGAGTGVVSGGAISGFQQTPVILSSQTITPPAGTKQIHALLAGGGGGGGGDFDYDPGQGYVIFGNGGGFGGCAIFNIPVTTDPLQVIVGAGGAGGIRSTYWPSCVGGGGGATMVRSGGVTWARVGGGGGGSSGFTTGGVGRFGGGGGAGCAYSWNYNDGYAGGNGGEPPIGQMLWYLYPPANPNSAWYRDTGIGYSSTQQVGFPQIPQGTGFNMSAQGSPGYFGGGGSGANTSNSNSYGYGGGGWANGIGYGGGARHSNQPAGFGGEVIWGRPVGTVGGSGGPGVFGNSTLNGGDGGGGGGGGGPSGNGGNGGSGGAVLRFYF